MPATITVIHARDFIRASPEGQVYLDQAEKLLQQIAEAGAGLSDFDVLVDTRRVTSALKATELWRLAEKLQSYRHTFAHKTAVLCPVEKFGKS